MAANATYLVGIDSGTQSTSVSVWTAAGRRVARATAPLKLRRPHPGWAEQDPRAVANLMARRRMDPETGGECAYERPARET